MKRVLPLIVIISIASVLTLSSYVHVFARHSRLPTDTPDMMIHLFFMDDYAAYLSIIAQGQSGRLLFQHPFTFDGRLVLTHTAYQIAGLISKPFDIKPPVVYHILKIATGFILIFSVWTFGAFIFNKKFHRYILLFLISFFPMFHLGNLLFNVGDKFIPWWIDGFGIISRFDMRPHHSLAASSLLLLIGLYIKKRSSLSKSNIIIISLLAICVVLNVPYSIIPFLFILLIDFVLLSPKLKIVIILRRIILPRLLFILPSIIILILMSFSIRGLEFWKSEIYWSIQFWQRDTYFLYHWYVSLLVLVIFALPGLLHIIRKKEKKYILLVGWIILPLFMAPWVNIHHISWGRMLHFYIQFPLGILAVIGLDSIINKYKFIGIAIVFTIAIASVFTARSELISQYQRINNEAYSREYYPRNITYQMIDGIKPFVKPYSKILTGYQTGLMLTSYLPLLTYVGEPEFGPWNYNSKYVNDLLTEKLNREEVEVLLSKYDLEFILDDPQHMEKRNWKRLSLTYLKSLWINEGYQLFILKGEE